MNNIQTLIIVFSLLLSSVVKAESGAFVLFSEEVKDECPSVLYDFLEHYLFELDSLESRNGTIENKLVEDKVMFIKGSPSTARNTITPSTSFLIKRTEDMSYEVVWTDTLNNELLHIAFPASFELILGMSKNKIEKTMGEQLKAMPEVFIPKNISSTLSLEQMDDGYFVSMPKLFLGIEELNTDTYYSKTDEDFLPIFTPLENVYSAKNLLHGIIDDCNEYNLYILQNLYDFEKVDYTLKLSQWLNYCSDIHATIYVAVEEEREDGLMLLLVAQNSDLGFQHALSLILPWNFVDKRDCMLKGKLNAFIPIHNVKTLYEENSDEFKNKKKGHKWHVN